MAKFEMHTEVKHYIENGFYIWTQSKEADTGRELSDEHQNIVEDGLLYYKPQIKRHIKIQSDCYF